MDGSWKIGEADTLEFQSIILDAKMKGFQVIFIILVPLMGLCLLGSFFVTDIVLKGDAKKNDKEMEGQRIQPGLKTPPISDEEKRDKGLV